MAISGTCTTSAASARRRAPSAPLLGSGEPDAAAGERPAGHRPTARRGTPGDGSRQFVIALVPGEIDGLGEHDGLAVAVAGGEEDVQLPVLHVPAEGQRAPRTQRREEAALDGDGVPRRRVVERGEHVERGAVVAANLDGHTALTDRRDEAPRIEALGDRAP